MPQRLGRYAVRRRIGSGGFATVWLAYDEQLDSPVAIKVLADNWTEDSHVRRRFVEEGRFLRKVDSPHVVGVYDAGELDDGRPYLVMTYADQGTLADRLEDGALAADQGLDVIRQVGLGLTALHRRGVLHRDVKPGNVLFRTDDSDDGTDDGPDDLKGGEVGEVGKPERVRAMLGDLGLGKSMDMSSRLTMIAGTPSFVAPEQARGESPDARADQFSLGALTYLVFTGRPPYGHASLAAAAEPGPPPRLGTPQRPFPDEVEEVVARALATDREERFPDVRSYVAALTQAVDARGVPAGRSRLLHDPQLTQVGARPSPAPAKPTKPRAAEPTASRRRRWPVVVAGVAALAVGGAAAYAVSERVDPIQTVRDAQGFISVEVPRSWETSLARDGWTPPGATASYPALRVGESSDPSGVFVGLMPGTEMPNALPAHDECGNEEEPVFGSSQNRRMQTVAYTDCPGVIIERVIRVSSNRWLWVQVRSEDRASANRVLDSIDTQGL